MEQQLTCPVHDPAMALPAIREHAVAIAEADFEGTLDEGPENLDGYSLEELKLETDSCMALVGFLVSRDIGDNQKLQQGLAEHLKAAQVAKPEECGTLLQAFREEADAFVNAIFMKQFQGVKDDGKHSILLSRLYRFRQAYYERSPKAADSERHYKDTETLLATGLNTATHHIPHLLYSLDMKMMINHLRAPGQPIMTRDEKVELARRSDHLAVWLAKTGLQQLDSYIKLLNGEEAIEAALVDITSTSKGYRSMINPKVIQLILSGDGEDEAKYGHRPKLGCPGAVAFPGFTSSVTELWRLSVGALEKAGHWD